MNILGPDSVVFGVDDLDTARRYLLDYGLVSTGVDGGGEQFEAFDGTSIALHHVNDPDLPPALSATCTLRETVYGVGDEATLDEIERSLARDRPVTRRPDGSVGSIDDMGFALRFQKTQRRRVTCAPERINSPGAPPARPMNEIGSDDSATLLPRTLSHVVYFVPDARKAEAFYVERLGFRVSDRFIGVGPFLRPAGSADHHAVFLIEAPPHMTGLEHLAFHVTGPTELLRIGTRFQKGGYRTFWGPGRHIMGSNWFWYFNSPFGCHFEYDADMDLHDDTWPPREVGMVEDSTQLFLFTARSKWVPGGRPE